MNVVSFTTGKSRQLDGRAVADETVTESDVADMSKLARLLGRVLRELATLRRRFYPRRTDFEDLPIAAGSKLSLSHRFNARVRWWVIDQNVVALLTRNTATDANTLVLDVAVGFGVATIRVEEAG